MGIGARWWVLQVVPGSGTKNGQGYTALFDLKRCINLDKGFLHRLLVIEGMGHQRKVCAWSKLAIGRKRWGWNAVETQYLRADARRSLVAVMGKEGW